MQIKIALAGNPNCGKTTLFNALTGSNQFVGNWPGVTVEKKEGRLKGIPGISAEDEVIITDLPGIYSLSPYTLEEVVARNYLIEERPDVILNVVDGTNPERNLYLTTQLTEIGIPVVIAINMMDVVRKKGDKLDIDILSKAMGCKVVEISALKSQGLVEAAITAVEAVNEHMEVRLHHIFSGEVEHALAHIEEAVLHEMPEEQQRWYAVKLFERDHKVISQLKIPDHILKHIDKDIIFCEKELDDDAESIITNERYNYIEALLKKCYVRKNRNASTTSDKIDNIVTNRWLALPIFAAIMFVVYYISVSTVGAFFTEWLSNTVFGEWISPAVADFLTSIDCVQWLKGLIVDGIIGGVGTVLGFVPQMLILFTFLAFLEACGYMSRIAFIMDKLFRKFGLSGKSFIPILIGTGCGVPGIMASRTIENDKDRKMTIITTTFIPCGAKLPIIALIAGAMFNGAAWVATSAYFVGIAAIMISGIILKHTKPFKSDPTPFVMELPPYHMPTFVNVMRSMWERGWGFIRKAGTVILLSTIVIWFAQNFGIENGRFGMIENIDKSILAYIGSSIAWLFKPLGWGTWEAAVSTISGLLAKENVVSSFGVLYSNAAGGKTVWQIFAENFTPIAAYSFMVFNLLCAPCVAAMGAIRREMNNWKWTGFAILYQCTFAYIVAFLIFNIGGLFI